MVNGNYMVYRDRPSSESEIVDDHVQTRTAERKTKRKANRTATELQLSLSQSQLDNETDSVKYEKRIKEPKLLRYVPTTEVEYNYVSQQFETHELKPTIERPKIYYVKKPKKVSDGSVKSSSYSRSSSTSPSGNLPTISEYCEQCSTLYRVRSEKNDAPPNESKLEKFFTKKPRDKTKFPNKVNYNGTHPDSLYRVPRAAAEGGLWGARALRLLRWPAALLLVCVALAGFVYCLMPDSMTSDVDMVNSTFWENTNELSADAHSDKLDTSDSQSQSRNQDTKNRDNITSTTENEKTPEIDFYDPIIDVIVLNEKDDEINQHKSFPIPPVFPDYIAPEVQYGNEKADTRAPKVLEKLTSPADSTGRPHITVKPEKPLAVYFKNSATTESVARAETESIAKAKYKPIERAGPIPTSEITDDLSNAKQTTKSDETRTNLVRSTEVSYQMPNHKYQFVDPELSPAQDVYRQPIQSDVPLTSGHSKFFGIGIEDAQKMTSSTTESSVYNTRVSPTLPTWRDGDDATTKHYPVSRDDVAASQCQSPQLHLCRGVLPYDLAGQPPTIDGREFTSLMPQIEYLISTNCSQRMRQYLCAILEPECSPPPYPPKLPCYNFCKAMAESCDGVIPSELATAFNCNQYAHTNSNCAPARSPCSVLESQCGDGSCIPHDWMCDGKIDCPGGEDEALCEECDDSEYRCASGSCIMKRWLCDGYRDCPHGDDEMDRACESTTSTAPPAQGSEPGEESAGSAPAPSVSELHRQNKQGIQAVQAKHEASQELLITSDSSYALKRNYTRRPFNSRLTPYISPVRTTTPEIEHATEIVKTVIPLKTTRREISSTTPKSDTKEDADITDFIFFQEFDKNPTKQRPTTQYTERVPVTSARTEKPGKLKESSTKPGKLKESSTKPAKIDESSTMPAKIDESSTKPAKLEESSKKPVMLDESTKKPETRLRSRKPTKYERIDFDGTALMMQSAIDPEKGQEEPEDVLSAVYDYEPEKTVGISTSHSSPCPAGELRCVDGRCITLSQLCDGVIDCSDHADEDNCFT